MSCEQCFIKSYSVISLFDDRNKEKGFGLRSWFTTVNIRRYLLAILFRVQWTEPSEQEKLEALELLAPADPIESSPGVRSPACTVKQTIQGCPVELGLLRHLVDPCPL